MILVLVILNHYILRFGMIFFIQQLNTGLKNYKIIYRYCDVLINDLYLKACLFIISQFSYFYINEIYIHQIKGTVMGTKFAVVGSNLVVIRRN